MTRRRMVTLKSMMQGKWVFNGNKFSKNNVFLILISNVNYKVWGLFRYYNLFRSEESGNSSDVICVEDD